MRTGAVEQTATLVPPRGRCHDKEEHSFVKITVADEPEFVSDYRL
jgi:hypothetical protein